MLKHHSIIEKIDFIIKNPDTINNYNNSCFTYIAAEIYLLLGKENSEILVRLNNGKDINVEEPINFYKALLLIYQTFTSAKFIMLELDFFVQLHKPH